MISTSVFEFRCPQLTISRSPTFQINTTPCWVVSRTHGPTNYFFPPNFHKGIASYVPTCALIGGDRAKDQAENQLCGKATFAEFHLGISQLAKTPNYDGRQISTATRIHLMDRPRTRTRVTVYFLKSRCNYHIILIIYI